MKLEVIFNDDRKSKIDVFDAKVDGIYIDYKFYEKDFFRARFPFSITKQIKIDGKIIYKEGK